jgi:hypothetical protein
MPFETPVLNAAADGATSVLAWASLHSADPGATGANELSGGSPAYARRQVTWNAASGAVAAMDGTQLFDIPPGSTVSHVGLWTAVTAGTWRGGEPLPAPESFTGQGTYELTALTVTAANA